MKPTETPTDFVKMTVVRERLHHAAGGTDALPKTQQAPGGHTEATFKEITEKVKAWRQICLPGGRRPSAPLQIDYKDAKGYQGQVQRDVQSWKKLYAIIVSNPGTEEGRGAAEWLNHCFLAKSAR